MKPTSLGKRTLAQTQTTNTSAPTPESAKKKARKGGDSNVGGPSPPAAARQQKLDEMIGSPKPSPFGAPGGSDTTAGKRKRNDEASTDAAGGDGHRQLHFSSRTTEKQGQPTAVLQEPFDNQYGRSALSGNKLDKANYREPQMQHHEGLGGTGFDEMVSTATVHKYAKSLPSKEAGKAVGDLSESRVETAKLVWSTDVETQPVAGHPGALSSKKGDMRKGVTKSHFTKDRNRAKAVKTELASNDPGKIKDAKLRAQAETVREFMHPHPQLTSTDVSQAEKSAYHPKFGKVIQGKTSGADGQKVEPAFEKMAADVHNEREFLKEETAKGLMQTGKGSLVHPQMREKLEGNVESTDLGPPTSQATALPPDKTLKELDAENLAAEQSGSPVPHVAVSPPRRRRKPQPKGGARDAPSQSGIQRTVTQLWRQSPESTSPSTDSPPTASPSAKSPTSDPSPTEAPSATPMDTTNS
ncbi:MAG: hypothetical protein AAGN66_23935 [Acidobacteriota bacterium]